MVIISTGPGPQITLNFNLTTGNSYYIVPINTVLILLSTFTGQIYGQAVSYNNGFLSPAGSLVTLTLSAGYPLPLLGFAVNNIYGITDGKGVVYIRFVNAYMNPETLITSFVSAAAIVAWTPPGNAIPAQAFSSTEILQVSYAPLSILYFNPPSGTTVPIGTPLVLFQSNIAYIVNNISYTVSTPTQTLIFPGAQTLTISSPFNNSSNDSSGSYYLSG